MVKGYEIKTSISLYLFHCTIILKHIKWHFPNFSLVTNNNNYHNNQTLDHVESFRFLSSLISQDVNCTMEVKSRISRAITLFMDKINLLQSKNMNISVRKRLIKVYTYLECRSIRMWILGTEQSGTKYSRNFRNVVVEKDFARELDGKKNQWKCTAWSKWNQVDA